MTSPTIRDQRAADLARWEQRHIIDLDKTGIIPVDHYAGRYHRPSMRPQTASVLYAPGGTVMDLPPRAAMLVQPDTQTLTLPTVAAPGDHYGKGGPHRHPFGERGRHRPRPDWTRRFIAGLLFLSALFIAMGLAGCSAPESPSGYRIPDSGPPVVVDRSEQPYANCVWSVEE